MENQKEFEIIKLEKQIKNKRNFGVVISTLNALSSALLLENAILSRDTSFAIAYSIASACFATGAILNAISTKTEINEKQEIIKELKK